MKITAYNQNGEVIGEALLPKDPPATLCVAMRAGIFDE